MPRVTELHEKQITFRLTQKMNHDTIVNTRKNALRCALEGTHTIIGAKQKAFDETMIADKKVILEF